VLVADDGRRTGKESPSRQPCSQAPVGVLGVHEVRGPQWSNLLEGAAAEEDGREACTFHRSRRIELADVLLAEASVADLPVGTNSGPHRVDEIRVA
jgi:hypothetical protein